jgi:hypothetical protein
MERKVPWPFSIFHFGYNALILSLRKIQKGKEKEKLNNGCDRRQIRRNGMSVPCIYGLSVVCYS